MRVVEPQSGTVRRALTPIVWCMVAFCIDGLQLVTYGQSPQPQPPTDLHPSPVIKSISLATAPDRVFPSTGEMWFTTWADDDNLYGTWGDGSGPTAFISWSLMTDR